MKREHFKWILLLFTFLIVLAGCGSSSKGNDSAKKSDAKVEKKDDAKSGASKKQYTDIKELKDNYDIVIIGAGGAGMSAAIEAKDAGLNPVILEKMPVAGGNTIKSSSGMNASGTEVQKANGIEDSNDKFFEESLKGGHGANDKELLRYFVDHSAEAIDWLKKNGIVLDNLSITGGSSVKRTHRPHDGSAVGGYLVDGLLRNVKERKIPLFVDANVTEISEKDGKPNGVTVKTKAGDKKITAKSVIVTTGGFGANKDMIKEHRPDLEGYVSTNSKGSTGDGIKMIEKLGGQAIDMDQIQVHPTVHQEDGALIGEALRGEGGILVNTKGDRFINELDTRDKVSAAINDQDGKFAYLIINKDIREHVKAVDFYEKKGYVKKADSLEDLAKELKLPADELKKTIEKWNKDVEEKKDSDFGRKTGMERSLKSGPYFVIKIGPGIHYSMGGVKINSNTEVLHKDTNKPIPGLYAAGELIGGLHGKNRLGGNSVADIIIFGRQAGKQATEFVKNKK